MVVVGMAVSGWKSSPYFWHKTDFVVVIIGIPLIFALLEVGWRVVRPKVVANTGDRLKAVWADDGPTYGPRVAANHDAIDGGNS
jgi:L-asparagine permease